MGAVACWSLIKDCDDSCQKIKENICSYQHNIAILTHTEQFGWDFLTETITNFTHLLCSSIVSVPFVENSVEYTRALHVASRGCNMFSYPKTEWTLFRHFLLDNLSGNFHNWFWHCPTVEIKVLCCSVTYHTNLSEQKRFFWGGGGLWCILTAQHWDKDRHTYR